MKEHRYTTFGGVNENRETIQAKGMVLAFFLQKNPSFKKSHPISIKSVGHLRTVNGNTRLGSTTQNVLEEYGESNSEIVVTIDRLKIIQEECPDMWIIHDVQLIDPNAADYFTELDSMQRKEGGEIEMAKKQDAFKHLHEHLILELVYFDKSNMIMHFGWCNHEEVISNQGFITCAYSQIGLK